ncbi:carbohydrate ABC transporter permease [Compostimonas suwonensis]|uniref:Multiple sugar transport system permease protein n=1 Tax=Compostimonas suwonensis TaxID=1048394 RepID=A0A2M9BVQ8_9MICO|nr:carbohydrate ABC transporter permease [Compostimonas suwonensis]PJJ61994.1 multiple sugar transport system permease protein [Compostimonas suwonensis]
MTTSTLAPGASKRRPRQRTAQRRSAALVWLNTLAMAIVSLLFAFPFIWMFLTALKPANEVFTKTPQLFGSQIMWSNFADAWTSVPFGMFIVNSFVVGVVGALLSVVVAILSAYAFSRLRFRFRDKLFLLYVVTLVLPQEVLVIPLFIMFNKAGLIDTYFALIIPFAFTAFGTFLLRQFFLTIPVEYEEAARIDGASRVRTLWSILLPQLRAPISVLAVFSFIGYWNSYLWPLIVINSEDKATVPLGLGMFTGQFGTQWSLLMAAATIAVIPSLIIVAVLQRQLVKGVALGGLGGR